MKPLEMTPEQKRALKRHVGILVLVPVLGFPLVAFLLSYLFLSADYLSDLPNIPMTDRIAFGLGGLTGGLAIAVFELLRLGSWFMFLDTLTPPKPKEPPTEPARPSPIEA